MRKRNAVTVNTIEKIAKLLDNGFNGKEISDFVGCCESTAQFYVRVLKSIDEQKECPVNETHYNRKEVELYCKKHGLIFIPMQDHKQGEQQIIPISETVCNTDNNRLQTRKILYDGLDLITEKLHKIADESNALKNDISSTVWTINLILSRLVDELYGEK